MSHRPVREGGWVGRPLPLKEDVDQETVNFLLERSEDYPGISVVEQWKRALASITAACR